MRPAEVKIPAGWSFPCIVEASCQSFPSPLSPLMGLGPAASACLRRSLFSKLMRLSYKPMIARGSHLTVIVKMASDLTSPNRALHTLLSYMIVTLLGRYEILTTSRASAFS